MTQQHKAVFNSSSYIVCDMCYLQYFLYTVYVTRNMCYMHYATCVVAIGTYIETSRHSITSLAASLLFAGVYLTRFLFTWEGLFFPSPHLFLYMWPASDHIFTVILYYISSGKSNIFSYSSVRKLFQASNNAGLYSCLTIFFI